MTKEYILENKSKSVGTYLYKGEYKQLKGGQSVRLKQQPTNKSENLSIHCVKIRHFIASKNKLKDEKKKEETN